MSIALLTSYLRMRTTCSSLRLGLHSLWPSPPCGMTMRGPRQLIPLSPLICSICANTGSCTLSLVVIAETSVHRERPPIQQQEPNSWTSSLDCNGDGEPGSAPRASYRATCTRDIFNLSWYCPNQSWLKKCTRWWRSWPEHSMSSPFSRYTRQSCARILGYLWTHMHRIKYWSSLTSTMVL